MSEGEKPKNGVLQTLAASGNASVQLGTLLVVVLSGVGSFFQTEKLSQQSLDDRNRAVQQIHILYERVDSFQARQIEVLNNQKQILDLLRQIQEKQK